MHLAIKANHFSIDVKRDRSVMVQARCAALEDGTRDHHPVLTRRPLQAVAGRPGDRLRPVENGMVLGLTGIGRIENFLQAYNVSTQLGRLRNAL